MNDDYDEFGADADFLEALAATDPTSSATQNQNAPIINQPIPQRLARLDQVPSQIKSSSGLKVVQPTPQILKSRSSTSSILVSPRQKGNPVLSNLRSFVWEYSDIPADYILGLTTCALFLSLKYHLLHPEYVYNRIKGLYGKYNLRILLTLVDIKNHEEPLKELTKTCLVNNVTFILCWSAAEAARYLELYKSYEHSKDSTGIKGIEKKSYAEKMVEFITVPRGINKTDAVSLVSAFGSIKGAINARPEEIAIIGGWGEKKVKRWCSVVNEPFRVRRTQIKSKTISMRDSNKSEPLISASVSYKLDKQKELEGTNQKNKSSSVNSLDPCATSTGAFEHLELDLLTDDKNDDNEDNNTDSGELTNTLKKKGDIEALPKAGKKIEQNTENNDEELSTGLSAALAKLRRETGDY
ncbi:Mating-type switching protein swi10 [Erysiphe neolycopersici]|uniref:Mating-type switching protein swi10 n=1 Tax=Erysiphe neolycopersici TaxID=212602 RepID=A0A420I1A1_9PEZI|nr:Mating-type switching protein swi10 [Erysiphe neolycopersici]